MASISSILSILVQANTNEATSKLKAFDDKMAKTRAEAAKKIEAQLGANFDRRAFDEYEARLKAAQDKIKNRAAFKAALGGDFNPAAFNAYQRAVAKSESDTRRMSGSLDALTNRFTGSQNKVDGFNASMMGLRNVVGLVKFPALIAGAGIATQALGALGAGAIGVVSALAPLAGAGAAAAAGYVAFGQAAGVAMLATDGLKKALAGNKAAIAALTPAQRVLLTDLQGVKAQMRSLQNVAAAGMTPGLEKGLRAVMPLFGVLKPIVAATAREMGGLAAQAGKAVSTWGKDLTTVGKTNVTVIHNLGGAAIMLGGALKNVVVAGGPLLVWMSALVKTGATWVQQQVYAGQQSGRLALFLGKTEEVMRLLIDSAINVGAALFNIGKAAAPLGTDLLQSLERLTIKMREWTASAQGQQKLRTYFDNMKAPLYAIFGLVGDIGKALIQLSGAPGLTHVVDKLRELVPVLQSVIGSTTNAFSGPFIDALTNIVKLFGDLAGTSGPLTLLVKVIGWIAGGIHSLMQSSPGMHSFVIDFVGFAAAVKALSFLPKLPVIGPLISLFTAAGKARSLKDILGLAGLGGGKGILGSAGKSVVATMEVGTLIAKTTLGGGGGAPGGLPGEAGAGAQTAERGLTTFQAVAGLATGVGTLFLTAIAFREVLGRYAHPFNTPAAHSVARTTTLGPTVVRGPGGQVIPQAAPVSRGSGSVGGLSPQAGTRNAAFQFPTASVEQVNRDFNQTVGLLAKLEQHQAGIKATASAFDDLAAKARKAGDIKWALADTLGSELLRTHNVASQGVMQLIGQLNRLAPGARSSAQQAMVQMTQMLETQGRLPVGSTARLVGEMLQSYSFMKDRSGVQFRGLMNDAGQTMNTLRERIRTSTGQQRQDAVNQYNHLLLQTDQTFNRMLGSVTQKTGSIKNAVSSNTHQAFQIGSKNFQGLAANIASYIGSGATATAQGLKNITEQINTALKGLGSTQLIGEATVKAASASQLAAVVTGQVSPGALASRTARGGLFQLGQQGQAGQDSIPVNAGGIPILAAPGEQIAVFNRHQQAVMNAALAPMGGLPGLFSKVNRPHYMARGGMVPGFAGGGVVPYGQLEGLWNQAGGPANMAPLMAAIAEAESGGNPNAANPSGASGLWQILGVPFAGNVFDPLTNAKMAVSKFRSQGLGAWVTYTSGAYKQFLNGAVPAVAGAGPVVLVAPKVVGGGPIGAGVQSGLDKIVTAANAYIAAQTPAAVPGGGPAIPFTHGQFTFPLPQGAWSPGQVDQGWDLSAAAHTPLLAIAAGTIQTPGISGFGPWAPILKLDGMGGVRVYYGHAGPGNALPVGTHVTAGQVIGEVGAGDIGTSTGPHLEIGWYPPGGSDAGASMKKALGYARGGMVKYGGAFAHGGMVPGAAGEPRMILAHGGEVVLPRFAPGGIVSHGRSSTPGALGVHHSGVISHGRSSTPGALGVHHIAPHHIAPHTAAWQHMLLGEPGPIGIPGKVPSTVFAAGQVQGKITDLRNQVSVLENQYGTLDQFYNITQPTLTDPTTGLVDQGGVQTRLGQLDRLIGIRQQIFQLWRRIVAWTNRLVKANSLILAHLKDQLAKIRGKKLKGDAGQTQQSIDQIRGNLAQAQGDLTSGSNDRDNAWVQLLQLRSDRAGVAGTQAAASAAANAPVTDPATLAALQQLLLQSQQSLLVSQAQYKVLSNAPPYGGSFAQGGIVPGPAGAPRTIVAHGGEQVGQQQPQVVLEMHFAPGTEWLKDFVDVRVAQAGRGTSRTAMRQLPGGR